VRNIFKAARAIAFVAVFGVSMAACGKGGGGLTFSDGKPSGSFSVYVVPDSSNGKSEGQLNLEKLSMIAVGGNGGVSGNRVVLFVFPNTGKPWTDSGTYKVILEAGNMSYIHNVSFSNGSAAIKKSDMVAATAGW